MNDLKIKHNTPLGPFTTFGFGGRAESVIEIRTPEELVSAVLSVRRNRKKYFLMAGGSNIVAGDKKFPGTVIVFRDREDLSDSIQIIGNKLTVFGSVPLWKIVDLANENGWAGLESLAGIPGTIGGAIYGNAGAYGHSISEVVEKVLIFDGKSERWLSKTECEFSYRESIFKKKSWLILSIQLKFKKEDRQKLLEKSRSIIAERTEKYPLDLKCPGSFFKNVLSAKCSKTALKKIDQTKIIDGKIPAGYLLAEVGARGMKVGGIKVADYHGNLLINEGGAKYKDVEKLVKILKERVKEKFGIKLEEEVRYLK